MKATNKQSRIEFAKAYIIANPLTGHRKVNQAIRKEYDGIGLRISEVSRLKDATLLDRTSKPTGRKGIKALIAIGAISSEDVKGKSWESVMALEDAYHRLLSSGFIEVEAKELIKATGKPFNSEPFKAMLVTRRQGIRRAKKEGLTTQQIADKISFNFRVKKSNPFDFLKREYKPRPKQDSTMLKSAFNKSYAWANKQQQKAEEATDQLYNQFGKPIYSNYGKGSFKRLK